MVIDWETSRLYQSMGLAHPKYMDEVVDKFDKAGDQRIPLR